MKLNSLEKIMLLSLIIVLVATAVILVKIEYADAQLSRGTLENILAEPETENCEFISIRDGMFTPMYIHLDFPQVIPEIQVHADDPQTQYNADETTTTWDFRTNSTDNFEITIKLPYNRESPSPRNIFYEVQVDDNIQQRMGNWQESGQMFCKVIEFFAHPAPKFPTETEIIETVAIWEREQHETTQNLQRSALDLVVIIAMTGLGGGIIFLVVLALVWQSKTRDSRNASLLARQFNKYLDKFENLSNLHAKQIEVMKLEFGSTLNQIRNAIGDLLLTKELSMKEKFKEFADKTIRDIQEDELLENTVDSPPPIVNLPKPDKEKEEKHFSFPFKVDDLKKLNPLSKKVKAKLEGRKLDDEDFVKSIQDMTEKELNEKYNEMIKQTERYYNDPSFVEQVNLVLKEFERRNKKWHQ